MTAANRAPSGGRHVPSGVPGQGPADLSAKLAAHRSQDGPSVTPGAPPGGYPKTVGGNPDAPADRQQSDPGGPPMTAPGTQQLSRQQAGNPGFNPVSAPY
jgi:hypothetical protein